MRFEGKHVLVVGGSGGIGRATALEFAREGAAGVAVHYARSREAAEATVREVEALGANGVAVRADVARRGEVEGMIDAVLQAFGRLDALVCYAGHPFDRETWFRPFEELKEDEFLAPLRVDLLGAVFCAQAAVAPMRRQGDGRIVLVGSTPALTGDRVGIPYLVAKAGVLALARALAQHFGPEGIRVNALAVGSVKTPPMEALTDEEAQELIQETVLKRMGAPEDVARAAVFLASDDASFLTGQTIVVDGGGAMR
jgi:3-oxoacyl-[acyl-carrier protein] reductase